MRRERGFILLAVIAVLTLAAAALAMVSLAARLGAKEVSISVDLAQAKTAREAVLARAVFGLSQDAIYADGRAFTHGINGIELEYRVLDARGLIDLNRAPEALLADFLAQFLPNTTQAASLAAAIADWRDEDDEERQDGAEKRRYENADLPGPANQAFVHVSEARRVIGMDAALFAAIAPYLVITGNADDGDTLPDPVYAPAPILEILDISPVRREEIWSARRDGAPPSTAQKQTVGGETAEDDDSHTANSIARRFLLTVETRNLGGTRTAEHFTFATGPALGEYAILSRRADTVGMAARLYGMDPKNDDF